VVRFIARRLAVLMGTVIVATALVHVFLSSAVEHAPLGAALRETPGFLTGFLRGEFGKTPGGGCPPVQPPVLRDPQCGQYGADDVARMMRRRVVVDLQLVIGGVLLALVLGITAGRAAAAHPGSKRARLARLLTAFQLACPPYWQAFMILLFFSAGSGYLLQLPFVSGQADYKPFFEDPLMYLRAMWIPWLVIALPMAAFITRIADASLRDVLDEDYLRTARAKGLGDARVVNRHALPVAAAPIALMAGVNMALLLMNLALTEAAFNIPGLYRLIKPALSSRDVPVIQAMMLEGVVLVVVANFLADAVQAALDPRVRA
jgi:ABC-type dipeptide/oligopeptide/nickel transport system permease component